MQIVKLTTEVGVKWQKALKIVFTFREIKSFKTNFKSV